VSEGAFDRDVHDLGVGDDPDHDAEVERLFSDAVERQIGEQRELSRLLGGLLDRLDRLEDQLERRSSEDREALDVTVSDAVETEAAHLRDEVSQQLTRIEQRVDRLLGAGLAEAGLAIGDELTTLRARVALARDDRRSDLKVANRIRVLEDRLDRTRAAVEDLGGAIDRQLTAQRAAIGDELSEIAEQLETRSRGMDAAQRDELLGAIGSLLDEGLDEGFGEMRRASDLLGEEVRRLGGEVEGTLSEVDARIEVVTGKLGEEVGRLGGEVEGTLSEVDARIEVVTGRLGEVVTALQEIAGRLAVVGDVTRLLVESASEPEEVEGPPRLRPSVLEPALAWHPCPECGRVAWTERGLVKHRRRHTEGS
jgi:hypothetical protein